MYFFLICYYFNKHKILCYFTQTQKHIHELFFKITKFNYFLLNTQIQKLKKVTLNFKMLIFKFLISLNFVKFKNF